VDLSSRRGEELNVAQFFNMKLLQSTGGSTTTMVRRLSASGGPTEQSIPASADQLIQALSAYFEQIKVQRFRLMF
jgi:hypothetical protein